MHKLPDRNPMLRRFRGSDCEVGSRGLDPRQYLRTKKTRAGFPGGRGQFNRAIARIGQLAFDHAATVMRTGTLTRRATAPFGIMGCLGRNQARGFQSTVLGRRQPEAQQDDCGDVAQRGHGGICRHAHTLVNGTLLTAAEGATQDAGSDPVPALPPLAPAKSPERTPRFMAFRPGAPTCRAGSLNSAVVRPRFKVRVLK